MFDGLEQAEEGLESLLDTAGEVAERMGVVAEELQEAVEPVALLARHSFPYYFGLAAAYAGSALGSTAVLEGARVLMGQPLAANAELLWWNTALSAGFAFLERYHIKASALHDSPVASFLAGPVGLAASVTALRYVVLGQGLESGTGTFLGVLVGGLIGFGTSCRAWYLARHGEEIGVGSMFFEPAQQFAAYVRQKRGD